MDGDWSACLEEFHINNIMASFTVRDYIRSRRPTLITFHCEVGDRVEVLYLHGPRYYAGFKSSQKRIPVILKILGAVYFQNYWNGLEPPKFLPLTGSKFTEQLPIQILYYTCSVIYY
eukprot:SAG31_NODE_824_length_11760_cov_17.390790_8_plen_117_part_00